MQKIEKVRAQIDKLDKKLLQILAKRFQLTEKIGSIKREKRLKINQPEREKKIIASLNHPDLPKELTKKILKMIFKASKKAQK